MAQRRYPHRTRRLSGNLAAVGFLFSSLIVSRDSGELDGVSFVGNSHGDGAGHRNVGSSPGIDRSFMGGPRDGNRDSYNAVSRPSNGAIPLGRFQLQASALVGLWAVLRGLIWYPFSDS